MYLWISWFALSCLITINFRTYIFALDPGRHFIRDHEAANCHIDFYASTANIVISSIGKLY
jgi:hypothetical protein